MAPLLWFLKLLILSSNIRASFKALKQPVTRRPRRDIDTVTSTKKNSMTTADRARRRAVKQELSVWVVFIVAVWIEHAADRTLGYVLPLYSQLKVVCALMLLFSRGIIAQVMFKKFIKPLVSPYERPLDAVGFGLGQILQLLTTLALFAPRGVLGWWNRHSREQHDVPSILANLRKPQRPQLARDLATSIESQQAKSTTEVSNRFAQGVSLAPKVIPRRPATNLSLSTSSQRPSSASVRYKPMPARSAPQAVASGSRALSSSTSRPGSSIYPLLSQLQAPQHPIGDAWNGSRSISGASASVAHKGKTREERDSPSHPPPPPEPTTLATRSPRNSLGVPIPPTPPQVALKRPSSSSSLSRLAIPPPPPSPPASPPVQARHTAVPPTPAPPGAFAFSPPPPTVRVAQLGHGGTDTAASPRQMASSAIAGLAMELGGNTLDFSKPSPAKKRRKALVKHESSSDSEDDVVETRSRPVRSLKKSRRGSSKGSTLAEILATEKEMEEAADSVGRRRKGNRVALDEDEYGGSDPADRSQDEESVEEQPLPAATTRSTRSTPRKRNAPNTNAESSRVRGKTSRQGSAAPSTSRRPAAATSLGSTGSRAMKLPSRSQSTTALPVPRSRSRLLQRPTQTSSSDETGPNTSTTASKKRVLSRSTSSATVTAPARKQRRVVLGSSNDPAATEMEIDGVPVVTRKARRKL